jgi:hypothetical protein
MNLRRSLPSALLLIATLGAALPSAAGAWEVRPTATSADFAAFHDRFSTAAYAYPRHRAAPLGLIGWEVWVDSSWDGEFDDEDFVPGAIDGDLTGGGLAIARVGARKGLPGGFDLGLSYGRALGGDVKLVSAELQWAWIDGGPLKPAVAFRLTGTRSVDPKAYELEQFGAEVLVSKGFTILTPYIGGGFARSTGRLERFGGGSFERTQNGPVLFAGATLNLLLPKITVEVEKGEAVQAALRVGFGF